MTGQPVYFLVTFTVHEGKLAAFEETVKAMVAGTRKEPGALGYEWYLSSDRKTYRLVETYADAQAAQAHMASPVVGELVPKLLQSGSMSSFEVYGDPGPEARKVLAGFGAAIYEFKNGLGR
ncbi:MAG TPA: putative quinol monooxygenase [Terriglobales bacterium]|nr:putative quinol monooxygenase [Terriglobales bacterium]